jgi:hypothetical protein
MDNHNANEFSPNYMHTGEDEYMYLAVDVVLAKGKVLAAYTVCKVQRQPGGTIGALTFHQGPVETLLSTDPKYRKLLPVLVPVEHAVVGDPDTDPACYAMCRHLREQIVAMRIASLGLEYDTAVWLVALRDSPVQGCEDWDVEYFITTMSDLPEGVSLYGGLTNFITRYLGNARTGQAPTA